MKRKCPDCLCLAEMDPDSPSSALENFLQSIGAISVRRCRDCNAAVFMVFGFHPMTRRRLNVTRRRSYWVTLAAMAVVTGYVVIQSMVR